MRVLLVDDHALFRQGLRALLEKEGSIEVVGEAGDGLEAVALSAKVAPDVVIMDISLPGVSGLEATRQIKEYIPSARVVILSGYADSIYVDQALKSGAMGYVHKDAVYDELMLALEAVKKDRPYLSSAVLQPVLAGYLQAGPSSGAMASYSKLTSREKEVFNLWARNCSRSEIGRRLCISPKTVDRHKSNIMEKLELRQEGDIRQFARLIGLLEP